MMAKWPLAKCPLAKCLLAKCPLAKCSDTLNYYVEWVITYAGSLSTVRMKIDYKQLWTQYMQCSCLQVLDYETLLCDRYIRTMN